MTRCVLTSVSALGIAVAACAPARDVSSVDACGPPFRDEASEFVAFGFVEKELPTVEPLLGQPLEGGRFYAVIDDEGFLGTVRLGLELPCILACIGCCGERHAAKWVEPLARRASGLTLAFGPVNGRYTSVMRRIPERWAAGEEDGPWTWMQVEDSSWRTILRLELASEPSVVEVRGRVCAKNTKEIEVRVQERRTSRLVSRTLRSPRPRQVLD